ncbi:glycosyltransferase [Corynebacterium sp.]|uniref:glycosyltransferase n=1 Tax=Corynebacterium sp. TaxID=1720 RepID=UPI0026DD98EB|nr:glycosyltransferase [Corynebacterium sp.]MDO4915176.1 glycosyltransferase [Corynebacterium sp.]
MTFHALYTSKSKNPTIETGSFAPTAQPSDLSAVAGGASSGDTRSAVSTLNSRADSENSAVASRVSTATQESSSATGENPHVAPGDSVQGNAESYHPTDPRQATVEIVIPVYNEATSLPTSIPHLVESLSSLVPFTTMVTIADNASIDNTWIVAGELERQLPSVRRVHLDQKGRGRMLKKVWLESECDVVAYMDVDLSTDLHALLPLLAPLVSDHSDIAIGSRLARSANVVRGSKREFISRTYNHMLRLMMSAHFSDAQCGFKAMRTDVARAILPHVEDPNWFFDTEVLLLAEKAGYRIHEVPVDWTDDPDSRVNVVETALQDLRGMWRVRRNIASHRINLDSFRRSSRTSEPPVLEGVRGRPEPQQSFLGMSGDSALSESPRR